MQERKIYDMCYYYIVMTLVGLSIDEPNDNRGSLNILTMYSYTSFGIPFNFSFFCTISIFSSYTNIGMPFKSILIVDLFITNNFIQVKKLSHAKTYKSHKPC